MNGGRRQLTKEQEIALFWWIGSASLVGTGVILMLAKPSRWLETLSGSFLTATTGIFYLLLARKFERENRQ